MKFNKNCLLYSPLSFVEIGKFIPVCQFFFFYLRVFNPRMRERFFLFIIIIIIIIIFFYEIYASWKALLSLERPFHDR